MAEFAAHQEFQFQLGAIKGIEVCHSRGGPHEFQFQLGAIKGFNSDILEII